MFVPRTNAPESELNLENYLIVMNKNGPDGIHQPESLLFHLFLLISGEDEVTQRPVISIFQLEVCGQ